MAAALEIRVEPVLCSPFVTNPEERKHRRTPTFSGNTKLLQDGKCHTNRKAQWKACWMKTSSTCMRTGSPARSPTVGKRNIMPLGEINVKNTLSIDHGFWLSTSPEKQPNRLISKNGYSCLTFILSMRIGEQKNLMINVNTVIKIYTSLYNHLGYLGSEVKIIVRGKNGADGGNKTVPCLIISFSRTPQSKGNMLSRKKKQDLHSTLYFGRDPLFYEWINSIVLNEMQHISNVERGQTKDGKKYYHKSNCMWSLNCPAELHTLSDDPWYLQSTIF